MDESNSVADDLLIAVKAATVAEVENFTNMEMNKITQWSPPKLRFNDQKSSHADIKKTQRKESNRYIPIQQPS
jgi:hypothetical protein